MKKLFIITTIIEFILILILGVIVLSNLTVTKRNEEGINALIKGHYAITCQRVVNLDEEAGEYYVYTCGMPNYDYLIGEEK